MEAKNNKRHIARRALLGEEIEDLEVAVDTSVPPLLRTDEPTQDHDDIAPLTFDDYESAEEIRSVSPEDISENEDIEQLYSLKTYEDDAAHTIKDSKEPLYKLKAAEVAHRQQESRGEIDSSAYEKRVITIAAVVVIIVVILTIIGLVMIQALF